MSLILNIMLITSIFKRVLTYFNIQNVTLKINCKQIIKSVNKNWIEKGKAKYYNITINACLLCYLEIWHTSTSKFLLTEVSNLTVSNIISSIKTYFISVWFFTKGHNRVFLNINFHCWINKETDGQETCN